MRKKVTAVIDEDIWALAKDRLPCSRSDFLEEQLRQYIGISDLNSEDELNYNLKQRKREIVLIEDEIKKLRNDKEKVSKIDDNFDSCMPAINRMQNVQGVVGRNQIRNLARLKNINPEHLIKHVEGLDFNLENYFERK